MGRPAASKPTYYASRKGYYTWHEGRQVCLAVGEETDPQVAVAAWQRFDELKKEHTKPKDKDDTAVITVLDIFIHHCKTKRKPDTAAIRQRFAQSFIDWMGAHVAKTLTVRELTPALVREWLDAMRTPRAYQRQDKAHLTHCWGDGSEREAISTLKAALTHSKKMGHINSNPLSEMTKPQAHSRGKDSVISEADHQTLLAHCNRRSPRFADYLTALYETGARPGEIAKVTAAEIKEVGGATVLDLTDWKTKAKTRERIIILSPALLPIVRRLAERHPTGPLFRGFTGKPYSPKRIVSNFNNLRKRLGLNPKLTAYSYRHRFATRWLAQGLSIDTLARLLGTSVTMIERHYGHTDVSALHRQLLAFQQGQVG